jgi:hypothetical protein
MFSGAKKNRGFDILHVKVLLNMAKDQGLKPEQMVTLLRQVNVFAINGKTLAQACKEVGAVGQSYYRWCKTVNPKCKS